MKTQLLASLIVAGLSTAAFAAQPAIQNQTAGVTPAAQVLVAEQDAEHNRASLIETRSNHDQVAQQDAEHNRASLIESGFDQGNLVAQQDAEHNRAS
ncbi:hypothetical protein NA655_06285 [Pseudomonas kuykendallii]|uniref:hypothetical protein n=1 Tax=Pseudomonas kuykendallii TaxID=1007099 RepID=UPI000B7D0D05|nr:hypothetical protein [Pseudomonas kuykendallii]MCQ4270626.1 hypothetical protein [Pseudomonas kuykendallii]